MLFQNLSHQSSLLGLAFWSVVSTLTEDDSKGSENARTFSKLHLALIESLVEAKVQRTSIKPEVLHVKHLVQFIGRAGDAMREDAANKSEKSVTAALERLGQVLLGLAAADMVWAAAGKAAAEVIGALQALPGGSCRAVQMYVMHLAGGGQN